MQNYTIICKYPKKISKKQIQKKGAEIWRNETFGLTLQGNLGVSCLVV